MAEKQNYSGGNSGQELLHVPRAIVLLLNIFLRFVVAFATLRVEDATRKCFVQKARWDRTIEKTLPYERMKVAYAMGD